MRDPELVFKAQLAASALERAWQRWRVMHGLVADPMPAISSYVGYSLEEPWGQPRVVFGLAAKDAEQLAALLNRHDCIGPVHAMIAGKQGAQAQAGPGAGRPLPVPPQAPSVVAEQSSAGDVRSLGKAKRPGIPAASEPDGPVYRQVARAAREAARQAAAAEQAIESGQPRGPEVTAGRPVAEAEAPTGQESASQGSAGQGSAGQESASQGSASKGSSAQGSAAQAPADGVPPGQGSAARAPADQESAGHESAAQAPADGVPAGQESAAQRSGPQEPAGQTPAGQATGVDGAASRQAAGERVSGGETGTAQAGAADQAAGSGQARLVPDGPAATEKATTPIPTREQAGHGPATGGSAGATASADQSGASGGRASGGEVTGRPAADQAGQQPGSAGQPAGQEDRGEHPYPAHSVRRDEGGHDNRDDDPPASPGDGGGSRPATQGIPGGGRSRKARGGQSKAGLTARAEPAGESSTRTSGSGVHSVAEGSGPGAGTETSTRLPDEPGAEAHDSSARAETRDASARAAELRTAELQAASLQTTAFQTAEIGATDAWADELVRASHSGRAADASAAAVPVASVPVASVPAASVPVASVPVASVPAASVPAENGAAGGVLTAGPAGQQSDEPGPLSLAASAARVAAEARIRAAMRRSRSSATQVSYATLDEAEALPVDETRSAVSVAGGSPAVAAVATARPSEEPLFGYEDDGDVAAAWGGPVFSPEQAAADPGVVPLRPRVDDLEDADDDDLDPAADERPEHSASSYARRNRITRGYGIPRLSRSKRPGAVPGL